MQALFSKLRWKQFYPEQALCFWVGFLTTGVWVTVLVACIEWFFLILTGGHGLGLLSWDIFFYYGLPGGAVAFWLGFLLRKIQPLSPHRWIWLMFLIPHVTFLFAGVQAEVTNSFENHRLDLNVDLSEALSTLEIYAEGALISGLVAVAVVGTVKLLLGPLRSCDGEFKLLP